ncbi:MAG: plasmid pRiA4b ORF-3 family protein [Candidatus Acidiferrales bacterium]
MKKRVEVYQIKVTLRGSRPAIWRRIQVRSDITLAKLHRILQRVMGWTDTHLREFVIGGQYYGIPGQDEGERRKTKDERNYTLGEVVAAASASFTYNYDFGDNWEHVLVVEAKLSPKGGVRYPVCLAGARACPPEDVGGLPGYEEFLEAMRDPTHPEHREFSEWIGGDFDPKAFDVDEVNQKLRSMR